MTKKLRILGLTLGLSLLITTTYSIKSYAKTQDNNYSIENKNELSPTKQEVISDENQVKEYAIQHNLPLESDGHKIKQIILNTDENAKKSLEDNASNSKANYRLIGDTCTIATPYEGYNTNRIAWSASGTGPGTLVNSVTRETSSEIFGEFSGKTSVVEAKVGFKIGQKWSCTGSYSVNLGAGEHKRVVGYFRYKGYFVKYYTFGGMRFIGTYEVGRPIGIDFIVYN